MSQLYALAEPAFWYRWTPRVALHAVARCALPCLALPCSLKPLTMTTRPSLPTERCWKPCTVVMRSRAGGSPGASPPPSSGSAATSASSTHSHVLSASVPLWEVDLDGVGPVRLRHVKLV